MQVGIYPTRNFATLGGVLRADHVARARQAVPLRISGSSRFRWILHVAMQVGLYLRDTHPGDHLQLSSCASRETCGFSAGGGKQILRRYAPQNDIREV